MLRCTTEVLAFNQQSLSISGATVLLLPCYYLFCVKGVQQWFDDGGGVGVGARPSTVSLMAELHSRLSVRPKFDVWIPLETDGDSLQGVLS